MVTYPYEWKILKLDDIARFFSEGEGEGGGGIVPQQNVSFTMRHPLYQSTAANFSTIVATHGYWAASFLIRGIPTVTRIICFWAFSSEAVTMCFKLVRRCWDSNTQRSACEENAQTDCGYTAAKTPLLAKFPIGFSLIFTSAKVILLKKMILGKIPGVIDMMLWK